MRGFWQKTLSLFLDVKSLLGIRDEAFVCNEPPLCGEKCRRERLLTSYRQVKAAFLVIFKKWPLVQF